MITIDGGDGMAVEVTLSRMKYNGALAWLHLGCWGLPAIPTNAVDVHPPHEVAHRIAMGELGHQLDDMIGGGCVLCRANRWGRDGRPLRPCPSPRAAELHAVEYRLAEGRL